MPTEHEYKYVLDLSLASEDLETMTSKSYHIEQGYLYFSKDMATRIRCMKNSEEEKWYFTFKQKIDNRVIEIEEEIDRRDGQDLFKICVRKLKKDRYVIDNKGIMWEVDFFKKENLYFILAEVELEEGAPRPKKLPNFLKDHILYEVPLTDNRFSNTNLGDIDFATNLYNELKRNQ